MSGDEKKNNYSGLRAGFESDVGGKGLAPHKKTGLNNVRRLYYLGEVEYKSEADRWADDRGP